MMRRGKRRVSGAVVVVAGMQGLPRSRSVSWVPAPAQGVRPLRLISASLSADQHAS